MTGRKPFEPADGIEARWRKCYALVESRNSGDEITYREVEELCECDRTGALAAMDEAREKLLGDKQLAVRTVERFGWIKMTAAEQIDFVEERRLRAGRQIARGMTAIVATQNHRDELSQFERQRLDQEQATALRHAELLGRRRKSLAELLKLTKGQQGEIAS